MILVVDDDEQIVGVLRTLLEAEGYTVKTAADGGQAYALVRSPDCRCMLLDVNMPRINGIQLLMLMQADGVKVPTIVMAGFTDFDEKEMKQFANVVRFFPKPFDLDDMLAAIKKHGLRKPKRRKKTRATPAAKKRSRK